MFAWRNPHAIRLKKHLGGGFMVHEVLYDVRHEVRTDIGVLVKLWSNFISCLIELTILGKLHHPYTTILVSSLDNNQQYWFRQCPAINLTTLEVIRRVKSANASILRALSTYQSQNYYGLNYKLQQGDHVVLAVTKYQVPTDRVVAQVTNQLHCMARLAILTCRTRLDWACHGSDLPIKRRYNFMFWLHPSFLKKWTTSCRVTLQYLI